MTQIQFINELDELGLCIFNYFPLDGMDIANDDKVLVSWPCHFKDLTYQNRIDIIRECKGKLK